MKMPILPPLPLASRHLLLASAIALAAGCAGLPDQRLAQEALERGDLATAQSNYQALAAMGYADAQVGLADMQVASGDSAQQAKAEKLYREAAQTSPRARARLGKWLAAKPGASDAEHREAERLLSQAFEQGEDSALVPLIVLYLQYPQSWPEIDPQQRIDQWRARADCRRPIWRRSSSTAPRAPTPSTWARSSRSASAGCGAWTCAGTNWPRSTRCRATRKSRRSCSNSCAPPTRPAGCPASGSTRWPGCSPTANSASPTRRPPRRCWKRSRRATPRPGSAWPSCSTTIPTRATWKRCSAT